MAWLDIGLLGVLAFSVVVGLIRGLVYEMLSVVVWVGAYFAAQWASPWTARFLPLGEQGSALNYGAAFVLSFVAALVMFGLVAQLVRVLVRKTSLSLTDRAFGAVFGALRGVLLLLVCTTIVSATPLSRTPEWRGSQGVQWLAMLLHGITPMLPADVTRHLPA